MFSTEWNTEEFGKVQREEGRAEGRAEGIAKGREEGKPLGEELLGKLLIRQKMDLGLSFDEAVRELGLPESVALKCRRHFEH